MKERRKDNCGRLLLFYMMMMVKQMESFHLSSFAIAVFNPTRFMLCHTIISSFDLTRPTAFAAETAKKTIQRSLQKLARTFINNEAREPLFVL